MESLLNQKYNNSLYITCSGFNNRSKSITKEVNLSEIDSGIIFYISDYCDENKKNAMEFKTDGIELYDIYYHEPVKTYSKMVTAIKEASSKQIYENIIIDITSFTHEHLLMLIAVLTDCHISGEITLCYNIAEKYSTNSTTEDDFWLTKGLNEIRTVLGYPGYTNVTSSNHLIIIVGFEIERALEAIRRFEYDKITIIYADKEGSFSEEFAAINKSRANMIKNVYDDVELKCMKLNDIGVFYNELEELIKDNQNHNNVIIPLNNKLSTTTVAKYALMNENIQLFYITAKEYNTKHYSEPSGTNIVTPFSLDFK